MNTNFKMVVGLVALLALSSVRAETFEAAVNTGSYEGKGGLASVSGYSAFLCTAEKAATLFGSSDVDVLDAYFANNFAAGESSLRTYGQELKSASWTEALGYYTFLGSVSGDLTASYLAFVLYGTGETGDRAFKVYGADNAECGAGYVVFDDTEGQIGVRGWTTASVPEPTSGVLLLLGLGGLALRRKRA